VFEVGVDRKEFSWGGTKAG